MGSFNPSFLLKAILACTLCRHVRNMSVHAFSVTHHPLSVCLTSLSFHFIVIVTKLGHDQVHQVQ